MLIRWLSPLTVLYSFSFVGGFALAAVIHAALWLEWASSVCFILGGVTALLWYVSQYGIRQALVLFVVCGSLSYAAEWIGVHTGYGFGPYGYSPSFAPLVFGVPLAVPLAWCMLLVIAKALAPVRSDPSLWQGMTLAQSQSPGKRRMLRERRNRRTRLFLLPALWGATMAVALALLLAPAAGQKRRETLSQLPAGGSAEGAAASYAIPISNLVCWWIAALLILSIVNYVHDEYFEAGKRAATGTPLIPSLLLVTAESMFLTLALRSGLWGAAALNAALLALLFLWKRRSVRSEARGARPRPR